MSLIDEIAEREARRVSLAIDMKNKEASESFLKNYHESTGQKLIVSEAMLERMKEIGISTDHVLVSLPLVRHTK